MEHIFYGIMMHAMHVPDGNQIDIKIKPLFNNDRAGIESSVVIEALVRAWQCIKIYALASTAAVTIRPTFQSFFAASLYQC